MPPQSAEPIGPRTVEWEQLRSILHRVSTHGLGGLSEEELWSLPSLYRKTLSDLSLLRSSGRAPHLVRELSQLCNRAHALIYRGIARRRQLGALAYVRDELPRAVRRRAAQLWAAIAVMTLFSILGWVHCNLDQSVAEDVLSPRMVGSIRTSLEAAREEADLGLAAQIPRERRSAMAVAITWNNVGVAVRAFAFGILGGLPSVLILAFNGYMLGAVAHLYFHTAPGIEIDLPLYFLAGVAPHGAIELPAICLAGAAGMLLGFSWIFPGHRARGEALRHAALDAGRLVVSCVLTLVAAGLIEGLITPLDPPARMSLESWFWIKILLGGFVFLSWLSWLVLCGRRGELNT